MSDVIDAQVIEFFQGAKQVGHRTGDQCEQLKRIGNTKLPTVYVFARNGSLATAALMRRTHPVEASPPVHFSEIAVYQACGIREYHHSVENRSASIVFG